MNFRKSLEHIYKYNRFMLFIYIFIYACKRVMFGI